MKLGRQKTVPNQIICDKIITLKKRQRKAIIVDAHTRGLIRSWLLQCR